MLPDIGWFWEIVTGEGNNVQAGNAAQLAKTSRAGRVTRVIRVIRLIRLIRIVKLYKQAKLAQKKLEDDEKKVRHEESKKQMAALNAQKKKSIKKPMNYQQVQSLTPQAPTQVQLTVAASSMGGEDLSGSNDNIAN